MIKAFHRKAACTAAAAGVALASQAFAQPGAFVYDTTAGTFTTYTGDLTDGTLNLQSINDGLHSYRVQRVGVDTELGFYGIGDADFGAELFLHNSIPSGDPTGAGDLAVFAGAGGGFDFVATDTFGNTFRGNVPRFELEDRSDALRPGIEGQGFLRDIVFSGPTFEGVDVAEFFDDDPIVNGTVFTFTFLIPGVNLQTYLATSGLGGAEVEVETVELRLQRVPLPATTGLAFAGLVPFGLATARRRR